MDRISVMRAFCRIVEMGSFTKAAKDLGVSSALLSRETKLLEESLGCVLIARTTRSMSLTEHGALYYAEARRLLAELESLDQVIQAGAGALKGSLRINAPLSFGLSVLSPILPDFMAAYPDLKVYLNLDDQVLDMVEGGFDVSIRVRADLPDSGFVAHKIGAVEQQLFAAPGYLDERGRPVHPDELKSHDLLAFTLADHAYQWALSGQDGAVDVSVEPKTTINNSLFLKNMLVAGQGIGALPSFLFGPAVEERALERVLPGYALPNRTIFALTTSRLGTDTKTRAFLDYLKTRLSETAAFGIVDVT